MRGRSRSSAGLSCTGRSAGRSTGPPPGLPYKCVELEVDGETFSVLLDTGNAVGWTVHEPRLLSRMESARGAATSAQTGSVEGELEAHATAAAVLELGDARVLRLAGAFFPKPHDDYHDANLNPFMLRGRTVTLDFVNDRLLLRTRQRLEQDRAQAPPGSVVRLPLYGSDWPFVPVAVNGAVGGLASEEVVTTVVPSRRSSRATAVRHVC